MPSSIVGGPRFTVRMKRVQLLHKSTFVASTAVNLLFLLLCEVRRAPVHTCIGRREAAHNLLEDSLQAPAEFFTTAPDQPDTA